MKAPTSFSVIHFKQEDAPATYMQVDTAKFYKYPTDRVSPKVAPTPHPKGEPGPTKPMKIENS